MILHGKFQSITTLEFIISRLWPDGVSETLNAIQQQNILATVDVRIDEIGVRAAKACLQGLLGSSINMPREVEPFVKDSTNLRKSSKYDLIF